MSSSGKDLGERKTGGDRETERNQRETSRYAQRHREKQIQRERDRKTEQQKKRKGGTHTELHIYEPKAVEIDTGRHRGRQKHLHRLPSSQKSETDQERGGGKER